MQAPKRQIPYLLVMLWLVAAPAWAVDSDGDGVDDSLDKFPTDPIAWEDTDDDGKPDSFFATYSDGFESGSLATFGWVNSSPYSWSTTTSYKFAGNRGAISTSSKQTSYIEKTYTTLIGGRLDYRVLGVPPLFTSCTGGGYGGNGTNSLQILVDGVVTLNVPCSTNWQLLSIPLSLGTHTYRFSVPASTTTGQIRFVLDEVRILDTTLIEDLDDDNDTYLDTVDLFPKDPTEWADNDTDGTGNNADVDDDDDSIADVSDNCPLYANIDQSDLDGDGIGHPCDSDVDGDGVNNDGDSDDDNDGVSDFYDTFPLDASRSTSHSGILYNFYGHNSGDYFGISVSDAGDVNADGYGDVIVGAHRDDNAGTDSGSASVLSGATGNILFQFNGQMNGFQSQFGYSVSSAGNLDGDSRPDFIIGALNDSDGVNTAIGSAWRYSGATGTKLSFNYGSHAGDNYGAAVSGVGDVNKDGRDDYVVGARYDELTTGDMGCARVYSGLDNVELFVFCGQANSDNFGAAVSGAGDVNKDGYPDIIVGASQDDTRATDAGKAVVFSGQNGSVLYTWVGKTAFDQYGASVSGAGDVNNDGYDDLIVGASLENFYGSADVGIARVYSGKTGKVIYTWHGDDYDDRFGQTVSDAGDINSDGYDDVMVGAPLDDNGFGGSGSVTVYSGINGSILYRMDGGYTNTTLGTAIANAGDVNADGVPDIMAGANGGNVNGSNSGIVRIFSGKALLTDNDSDGLKDFVDADDDNDGVADTVDDYPLDATKTSDPDGDRIDSSVDNCDNHFNPGQDDLDGDGQGDPCDADEDNDGVFGTTDKFPRAVAVSVDSDSDGFADSWNAACDATCQASSGLKLDICPDTGNTGQSDFDGDGQGDACDSDGDNDGVPTVTDSFPYDVARSAGNTNILYTVMGDADDWFGRSVSDAGDVNGDGYLDVIVGADGDDNNGYNTGSARVLSGNDGSILYTFNGDSADDSFASAVSAAGDVNGDGYADVIVGARRDDNNGTDSGSARVFSGKDGAILYIFNGDSAGDSFGLSVSGAGDVNGDGYADVIVGAPLDDVINDTSGSAWIFSGKTGSTLYTFHGANADDRLGYSVSGAGDVDKDGYADVIVGLGYSDGVGINSGSARVISGKTGTILYTFTGDSASSYFGSSVSGVGDVNGDGYVDLMVGAVGDNNNGTSSGSASVFSGKTGSLLYTFSGDSPNDSFGYRVSAAGDVNGDGYADVAVGSWTDDNHGSSSGSARIFSGKTGSILYTFNGDAANDNMGWAVSSAGDVNSDGYADVIVGGWGNDNNGNNAGFARVFNGRGLWVDSDGDGQNDAIDDDDDNDGISDINDSTPRGNGVDTDSDGTIDTFDTDDDNDGVLDVNDKFPLDATKSKFVRHDTEVDGDSDVLVRSASTGAWTSYGIQNNTVIDAAVMNAPTASNISYVAQLDANGDGDADILTRNTATGAWYLHQVQNGAVTSTAPIYLYASLDQKFIGTGDFNNDGVDDVMLRSTSAGYYTVFLLGNHAVNSTVFYNAWTAASSVPQAIGDFDGDGTDDLLVRRTSDNLYFIFKTTNGGTTSNYCACNIWANTDWTFQFAGDTNKDGIDDIVIRGTGASADGKWWAFRMNNFKSVLTTNLNLFVNKTAVSVGAVGDYNGDGTVDVLTRVNNSTTYVSPIVNGAITGNYWLYNFTSDQVIGK